MFENWNEAKNVLMEGLSSTHKEILDPLLENQKSYIRSIIENDGGWGCPKNFR